MNCSEFTFVTLETDLGDVTAVITSGSHARVYASGPINAPADERFTLRWKGIEFTASVHLFKIDGKWRTHDPDTGFVSQVTGSRIEPVGPRHRPDYSLTEGMIGAVRSKFVNALQKYADENPDVFEHAARQDHERRIRRAEEQVLKAEAQLQAAKNELRAVKEEAR